MTNANEEKHGSHDFMMERLLTAHRTPRLLGTQFGKRFSHPVLASCGPRTVTERMAKKRGNNANPEIDISVVICGHVNRYPLL
jgi:hypothetical protein